MTRALIGASLLAMVLAGCQVSEFAHDAPHLAPVPAKLQGKINRMGMSKNSPILVRIFKEESALEVWKRDRTGHFQMLKEYEICAWSGELGPKIKEGDRQAPEGFYNVSPGQMNPNSSYHLAFNIGFPNTYDRSHGRTGSHLMVHGDCSSRGCYAMEDDQIEEIYALAREAFRGGQRAFQIQAFPFRMTPDNMARHKDSEHFAFWEMLKKGSDHFEVTRKQPQVDVCGRSYVFNATDASEFSSREACPAYDVRDDVEQLVAAKWQSDLEKRGTLIAKAAAKEEREERWEARERAIAEFFDRSRSERDEAPGDSVTTEVAATSAPVAVAGIPLPRRSPIERAAVDVAAKKSGNGFRFPNPFRRDDPAPVASTAGVAVDPAPARAVTPAAPAAPQQVASRQTPPAAPSETKVEALGYAPSGEDDGFFGSIAKGSAGLFRRAGSIFN
ncbi:MAG: murein L,D-transpeptidase family protein [Pseudomonadota bacterium]